MTNKKFDSIIDEEYFNEYKRLKMFTESIFLADLLFLNIAYSNHKYQNTTGSSLYNVLNEQLDYTSKEKDKIIENAINLLSIKHRLIITDFENLEYKEEK